MNISTLYINVLSVKENIKRIKSSLGANQKYCFVAKANAYGFGLKICEYVEGDVDCFAVSSPAEFFELNRLVKKQIIILDPVYENIKELANAGAIFTVSNISALEEILKAAKKSKVKLKVFIKLNTGMNRFGFDEEKEVIEVCEKLKKSQNIVVFGAYSHYFEAKNEVFVQKQNEKFSIMRNIICQFFGENLIFHIAATEGASASIQKKYNDFQMIRIGMGNFSDRFYPTLSLVSKVMEVHKVKAGEGAGYGAAFSPKKDSLVAAVGIGYGDGLLRSIVKEGKVLIRGKFFPIVAICMDVILVDVTGDFVSIGDDVTLIGRQGKNQIFVCDVAAWCDTIEYEIIVRLSLRIRRKYFSRRNSCKSSQESIEQENFCQFQQQPQGQHLQG